jgi:hypothetical protein
MDLKLVGLEEWCQRETMEIVLYGNSRSLELGLSFPIFQCTGFRVAMEFSICVKNINK